MVNGKKCVIVTGASGGIGSAISKNLIESGFYVFGLDLNDGGFADENYFFIQTDITKTESVKSSFEKVSSLTEELFGIVNTAGIVYMGSLIEEDPDFMQKILDVNVSGMARVNRVFFPLLEKCKGRIVNFSSEYGRFCSIPFHGYYTASKHAVERYTDSLRRELNYLGLKVVGIRPGAVNTKMTSSTVPNFERILSTTTHFERSYKKLYPLMVGATKNPLSPDKIAKKVNLALTKKHPKKYYNIHQDFRVKMLSFLPASFTDFIFKKFI